MNKRSIKIPERCSAQIKEMWEDSEGFWAAAAPGWCFDNSSDVWFISNYNGLTLVEVQNDNSKNILDDTGDSFISLAKDAPVTLGVGSWKQGDTFVLECKNEGSNAIKINIRNTSSGENWPYTLETGTGSITFTAPYDGEFEITVENLSDTDANLSISYTLTR